MCCPHKLVRFRAARWGVIRFGSIFMQSIKILPPAEMGPEADPLLREGGNAAHRAEKDGRKLPGWGQWDLAPQGRKQMGQDA